MKDNFCEDSDLDGNLLDGNQLDDNLLDDNLLGCFAVSKAGHDKNQLYVIVGQDCEYVYLSDGRLKPLSHPKKKKIKHVQVMKRKADRALIERFHEGGAIFDEQIKHAIKSQKSQSSGSY